jgi:hypothetical protein
MLPQRLFFGFLEKVTASRAADAREAIRDSVGWLM